MKYFIFNGDADGIIATRLFMHSQKGGHEQVSCPPFCESDSIKQTENFTFITGVKRDISLLKQVELELLEIRGHEQVSYPLISCFVFDIAVEKNLGPLEFLLSQNCSIQWFDHHISPEIPENSKFQAYINTDSKINTSWLVSNHFNLFNAWTVAGLFGDSMTETALQLAKRLELEEKKVEQLKLFGELLNYNAYGEQVEDLYFSPEEILRKSLEFENIFDFIEQTDINKVLLEGRKEDSEKAKNATILAPGIIQFPNEKWAKRVIGDYANQITREEPDRAHAVLVENKDGDFVVSVRSAVNVARNVAEFCRQFPTGGGRMKAGGINKLPKGDLGLFTLAFHKYFTS